MPVIRRVSVGVVDRDPDAAARLLPIIICVEAPVANPSRRGGISRCTGGNGYIDALMSQSRMYRDCRTKLHAHIVAAKLATKMCSDLAGRCRITPSYRRRIRRAGRAWINVATGKE